LIRAEALYRRFQRTVEAIDKKANFPNPKLRQRPANQPSTSSESINSPSPDDVDPEFLPVTPATAHVKASSESRPQGSTSGTDVVARPGHPRSSQSIDKGRPVDKGKRKVSGEIERSTQELQEPTRPKVISSELRELLSRKVEILPRRVVRKEGEGLAKVRK